jgi:hypothetical protein
MSDLSFRGTAKPRTRNLEIPGLRLSAHPGMTKMGGDRSVDTFGTALQD